MTNDAGVYKFVAAPFVFCARVFPTVKCSPHIYIHTYSFSFSFLLLFKAKFVFARDKDVKGGTHGRTDRQTDREKEDKKASF